MWWIIFTAVDLYVGLVVLEALIPSLSDEKRRGAILARRVIIALLVLLVIALVAVLIRRWSVHT